jgi:hypothetical protein
MHAGLGCDRASGDLGCVGLAGSVPGTAGLCILSVRTVSGRPRLRDTSSGGDRVGTRPYPCMSGESSSHRHRARSPC